MWAPSREEQSPTTPALRDGIHDLCPRPLGQADSNQGEDFWEGNLRGAPPCAWATASWFHNQHGGLKAPTHRGGPLMVRSAPVLSADSQGNWRGRFAGADRWGKAHLWLRLRAPNLTLCRMWGALPQHGTVGGLINLAGHRPKPIIPLVHASPLTSHRYMLSAIPARTYRPVGEVVRQVTGPGQFTKYFFVSFSLHVGSVCLPTIEFVTEPVNCSSWEDVSRTWCIFSRLNHHLPVPIPLHWQ